MEGKNQKTNEVQHEAIIKIDDVSRDFSVGQNTIPAVKNINLKIYATDFAVVFGPSGCGKSTLLNLMLGLDIPSRGTIKVRDKTINTLEEDERADFRAKKMGVVHQMPYWIKSLTTIENVALPLIIQGVEESNAIRQARKIMSDLGIVEYSGQIPTQLSGGQQQKAGVARALVTNPWILMADEPTGNLDSKSGDEIINLFKELNTKHKRTIVLVTHNESYWDFGNRRIEMKDGGIIKDSRHE